VAISESVDGRPSIALKDAEESRRWSAATCRAPHASLAVIGDDHFLDRALPLDSPFSGNFEVVRHVSCGDKGRCPARLDGLAQRFCGVSALVLHADFANAVSPRS